MIATLKASDDRKETLALLCVPSLLNCNMSFNSNEDEDNERMSMKSLEDLPTDEDSESVGSSTTCSDDLASGDETEPHTNLTVNKARRSYEEASSSSDGSSEDSSDDSSNNNNSSDDDDDEIEEQVTNRQHQKQQFHNDRDSASSEQEDDLQNVPLEERIRKRQEEGLSKRARAAAKRQRASSQALQVASQRLKQEGEQKKKSKHRPTQVSSKRSDFFKRGAPTLDSSGLGVEITAHLYKKPRDPRLLGATSKSTGAVDSNYAFIQELRQKEISLLKKKIAVQKLTGKKGQKARRKMNVQRDSLKVASYGLSSWICVLSLFYYITVTVNSSYICSYYMHSFFPVYYSMIKRN
jgi:hypothetical protein